MRRIAFVAAGLLSTLVVLVPTGAARADQTVHAYGGVPTPLTPFNNVCSGTHPPSGTGTGSLAEVAGPATPPLGVGSLEVHSGTQPTIAGVRQRFSTGIDGSSLSALSVMHNEPATGGSAPLVLLVMDRNGDGASFDTLAYAPATGSAGAWQSIDGLSVNYFFNGGAGGTYAGYMSNFPGAKLDAIYVGDVQCNAGTDLIGYIDDLVIGVNGTSTTYDFEPQAPAALAATSSTGALTAGKPVTLTGTLTNNGSPVNAEAVQLWAKTYPATTYHLVTTATTNASGVVSSRQTPTVQTSYQWRHVGDMFAPATSPTKTVAVRTALTKNVEDTTLKASQPLVMWGTATPVHAGATVSLVRVAGGRSTTVARTTVRSDGTWLFDHTLPRGKNAVHVTIPAGHGNLAGSTPAVTITVS